MTPNKLGRFDVVCAELCGLGHAFMRQYVNVVSKTRYLLWLRAAGGGTAATAAPKPGSSAQAATPAIDGKQLFVAGKPATGAVACGACHTLKAAGTTATTGPSLDAVLKGWTPARIRSAIADPNAQIAKGYGAGIMPQNFRQTLAPAELDALVAYLGKSVNG